MSTATEPAAATTPPPRSPGERGLIAATVRTLGPGRAVLFTDQTWTDYRYAKDEAWNAGRRLRITFDRGLLEIMSTSSVHEVWKKVLAGLIECLAEEIGLAFVGCGSMTIEREGAGRGFMPDECYYLRSAARILPVRDLDFAVDPPPDLAVEVERTRDVIPKLPLYAAFRVPEVWRFDGTALTVLTLGPDGTYHPAESSPSFPTVPVTELTRYLALADTVDQGSIVRQFRTWVRQTLVPPGSA